METTTAQATFLTSDTSETNSTETPAQRSLSVYSTESLNLKDADSKSHSTFSKLDEEVPEENSFNLWSYVPTLNSLSSYIFTPFSQKQEDIKKAPKKELKSVPLQTFYNSSTATTSLSNVVATRGSKPSTGLIKRPLPSENDDSTDLPQPLKYYESLEQYPEPERIDFAIEETNDPKRRNKAKHQLENNGAANDLTDWMPGFFAPVLQTSASSPGYVQRLVISALLSPTSNSGKGHPTQMGRRLFSLMTGSAISGPNGNSSSPLAIQFRPKLDLYPEDEDYELQTSLTNDESNLVELRPITKGFIPRVTLDFPNYGSSYASPPLSPSFAPSSPQVHDLNGTSYHKYEAIPGW